MDRLNVYREVLGTYELVGSIERDGAADATFVYDLSYLANPTARPLSNSLPLDVQAADSRTTLAFFEGLLPEGSIRKLFASAAHADAGDFPALLSRLNNESVGALVFMDEKNAQDMVRTRSYRPLSASKLEEFARRPEAAALEMSMASRLSLAGAQTKIGLYHYGEDPASGWYLPQGSAPSTHILKVEAPGSPFVGQTLNEALCLLTARYAGFDAADFSLIPMGDDLPPLLAVERFDRVVTSDAPTVCDVPLPYRCHQEDLCQAGGMPSHLKYEPTGGHYLSLGAHIVSRASTNPFGDSRFFLESVLFDFIMGNCDNHLKNRSILWSPDWGTHELSPLYDLTCTTMYPQLDREMGIALCASRRIDDVTPDDIALAGKPFRLSPEACWRIYQSNCRDSMEALGKAEDTLREQGFLGVSPIAEHIRTDFEARAPWS